MLRFVSLASAMLCLVHAVSAGAYSASGGHIVDEHDRVVQLRGVNWFGFETETHAPHGLWARDWAGMLTQMETIGANAIRVPLCPGTIAGVATRGVDPDLNPDLVDMNSAELLDHLVRAMSDRGFYVLLDHHRPDCQRISELWHTRDYSEEAWIADLVELARRFRDVPGVIGIDLKNEPHGEATWEAGQPRTDWNRAAERAAHAVLEIAPQWLMFVEGISDTSRCSRDGPAFWGENLEPMACTPLDIPPDRLVLAPHTYGPDVHPQPFFDDPRFPANMPEIWDRRFGQFVAQGYTVMLGEFGGRYGEGDPRDRAWQDALVFYLIGKGIHSGFYWSWNPNSDDTGGLLRDDWRTLHQEKVSLLRTLWFGDTEAPAPPPDDAYTEATTSDAGSEPPAESRDRSGKQPDAGITTHVDRLSTWGEGLCEQVTVRNTSSRQVIWRVSRQLDGQISQLWNAASEPGAAGTRFRGVSWNATLDPGASAHFGYCLERRRSGPTAMPRAPADGSITTTLTLQSDWGEGYCVQVDVRNTGAQPSTWAAQVPIEGRIREFWNAEYSRENGMLTVRGKPHNAQLRPDEQTHFGFCALR